MPLAASLGASPGAFYWPPTASLGANSQQLPGDSKSPGLVVVVVVSRTIVVVVLGAVLALHVVQGIVSPHIRVPKTCGQLDPVRIAV
jgi:hypothetical protein